MKTSRIPLYFRNPRDGTEMVLVPGGWFFMGNNKEDDPDAYDSEAPRHLHFVRPFYMAITCITVAQFRRFVRETGYRGGDYPGTGDEFEERWGYWEKDPDGHPVRYVNWLDAAEYCTWAGLRLPTEAEWELAARGYKALKYPWGEDWENGRRVCWDKQRGPGGATAPVFDHPEGVGVFGTFQQSGNVWEWCQDRYDSDAYKRYARGDFTPPGSKERRVLRGASWSFFLTEFFRGGLRSHNGPQDRHDFSGLRSARTVTL